jgi:putative nucleotidyltransferase with HDIG domain
VLTMTGGSARSSAIDAEVGRWTARPWAARAVRLAVALIPICLSTLATRAVAELWERPNGATQLMWWVGLTVTGLAVLVATDRVARRLLPLSALLQLSLIFPDSAPSRFGTALRTGTVKQLRERMAQPGADVATPAEAAAILVELVQALNAHDRLTRGHCERVRAYCDLLAEELRLPGSDRELLHWAALLHDIGKLDVPTEILTKAGQPTESEWEVLRQHPDFGMRIIAPLRGWLGEWALAVGEHHERWDGGGYPAGLSGTDISLAGRIVAVADTFDVITAARSYKRPIPPEQARAELARCSGSQFDPAIVRAFLQISLGRLRLAMGPLAWITQLPGAGGVTSLGPAATASISTVASAATVAAVVAVGSVVMPTSSTSSSTPLAVGTVEQAAAPSDATDPEHVDDAAQDDGREQHALGADAVAPLDSDAAPASSTTSPETLPSIADTAGTGWAGSATVSSGGRETSVTAEPTTTTPTGLVGGRTSTSTGPSPAPSPATSTPPTTAAPTTIPPPAAAPTTTAPPTTAPTAAPTTTAPPASTALQPDVATVQSGHNVNIDVLANDVGVERGTLAVATPPGAGTASVHGHKIQYEAPADFVGTDQFSYTACDAAGACTTALVTVTVDS